MTISDAIEGAKAAEKAIDDSLADANEAERQIEGLMETGPWCNRDMEVLDSIRDLLVDIVCALGDA